MQPAVIDSLHFQAGPQHVTRVLVNAFLHASSNVTLKSRLALGLLCF